MKKKLFLHIGQSKTGTTSLQKFLQDNRTHLKEKGFYYPDTLYYGHLGLSDWLLKKFERKTFGLIPVDPQIDVSNRFDLLHQEIEKSHCNTIVLSSELFFNLGDDCWLEHSEEIIQYLASQLKRYDVYVVCYIRQIESFVHSMYNQIIKDSSRYESLTNLLNRWYITNNYQINPIKVLDLYAKMFGKNKMLVRAFDRKSLVNQNSIDDFFDLIGFSFNMNNTGLLNTNPSLSEESIVFKKQINKLLKNNFTSDLDSRYTDKASKELGFLLSMTKETHQFNNPVFNNKIKETLQANQDQLQERYGITLDPIGDSLFLEDTDHKNDLFMVLVTAMYKEILRLRQTVDRLEAKIDNEQPKQ